MARWLSSPIYTSSPEMPIDVKDGVSVVLLEDGTWTDLEPAYQTVMLKGEDAFLWIETVWANVSLTRLSPSLMDLEFRGTVEARGWVYLSQDGENAMVIELALGNTPDELFRKAEAEVVRAACQWRKMEMERVDARVELGDRGSMRRPVRTMRCVLPPFLVDAVFETRSRLVRICQSMTNLGLYQCVRQDFFWLSVETGPFEGNWADELAEILNCLRASPRLLKGLRQLLTRRQVEIDKNHEAPEEEREEEAPQEVANLQRSRGDLEDLEKAFADIGLSLRDREGGEVMRAPPGIKLSFHALPVGKLKIQIGTHHTDALVDGGAEITLIRRNFATIMGYTVNKEVTGSIRGAGGEIPFAGYVTKCAVKAGVRESIWSFQRMTVMEEMDHDIILGRPWCANVEIIGMHLHDGTYMVDIEDPVTGRGELLRLLGTGGDPPKGKFATWSPSFEESARKGAFALMEGMRERVEIMIEEAFNKKE
ncbi:hypothetical protein CBR_g48251 [Chara braunii]|uniref:Peptidase A2 domain-containing protein n=1 Tax=Chara braunii TaxID=69332 RepID=A0A388M2E0_CHABU|nr:hypothetical protein CBR_g48251 [Chara braunii]|eukprot:GBG88721.1 hypothetical protein CBR_g48251 [Chara braunii]